MIVSAPNSLLHLSISSHICFVFSMSNFLALKNLDHCTVNLYSYSCYNYKNIYSWTRNYICHKCYLSIIWGSSCFEGNSSSKISAWRKASTACNSSPSSSSSREIDATLLCLRPFLAKECLNLLEALIATFFSDPSFVFLSSSEDSISWPVFARRKRIHSHKFEWDDRKKEISHVKHLYPAAVVSINSLGKYKLHVFPIG